MTSRTPGDRPPLQDHAWLIAVPKRTEFSEPSFHFGERVKFFRGEGCDRVWETGRMNGGEQDQYRYPMPLDPESAFTECRVREVIARSVKLQLVKDSCFEREAPSLQRSFLRFSTEKLFNDGENIAEIVGNDRLSHGQNLPVDQFPKEAVSIVN